MFILLDWLPNPDYYLPMIIECKGERTDEYISFPRSSARYISSQKIESKTQVKTLDAAFHLALLREWIGQIDFSFFEKATILGEWKLSLPARGGSVVSVCVSPCIHTFMFECI